MTAGERRCPSCGAALGERQRWCLSCGDAAATVVAAAPRRTVALGLAATALALLVLAAAGYGIAALAS